MSKPVGIGCGCYLGYHVSSLYWLTLRLPVY